MRSVVSAPSVRPVGTITALLLPVPALSVAPASDAAVPPVPPLAEPPVVPVPLVPLLTPVPPLLLPPDISPAAPASSPTRLGCELSKPLYVAQPMTRLVTT